MSQKTQKRTKKRGRRPGSSLVDPQEISRMEPMTSEIQSIIFDPDEGWTTVKARRFLNRHKISPLKRAHVTRSGKIHIRIQPPDLFERLRTKQIAPGVMFIFGFKE
jgi:hypothetical protein